MDVKPVATERVDFSRNAPVYDRRHGSFIGDELAGRLSTLAGFDAQSLILDVGAGTGRVAIPFAAHHCRVVGIDATHAMLASLRAKADGLALPAMVADAAKLPFGDHVFDAVVVARLLYLVPAWRQVLDEVRRVVRPGGHVLHEWGNGDTTEEWVQVRERARAIFEEAGVASPFHPGVRTEAEVDRALAERGFALKDLVEFEADVRMTLGDFLTRIGSGECSYTWKLPPDVQRACLPKLVDWVTTHYDLTHIVASPIVWKVYRAPDTA